MLSPKETTSTANSCQCVIKTLNLSNGGFHNLLNTSSCNCKCYNSLLLHKNEMDFFPKFFTEFHQLTTLDISNNNFTTIPDEICVISNLRKLIVKCNQISDEGVPEKLEFLSNLSYLDFSGNKLRSLPKPILELSNLIELDLGGNQICAISSDIRVLRKLEVLYLGGNQLEEIPPEFGLLSRLKLLNLCDNELEAIPATLGQLRKLEGLSLHDNRLHTLPPQIVKLRRLKELSLRNNPLVKHFVRALDWEVPSLLELAGRAIVSNRVDFRRDSDDLPTTLVTYLNTAQRCANPLCCGVYFSSRIEHIKFKDFCGKFRMPLLQFLCSPNCDAYSVSDATESDIDDDNSGKMKKVLLG